MPTYKWLIIARNEYRIRTSKIRKIRPYFPLAIIGLLTIFVIYGAPAFIRLFIDDFLTLFLSQVALTMMQVISFTIFIYFILIPVSDTLREEQTRQLEIFLAAPLNPSDVLFGEFLGEMPFYSIFITVLTGLFTALFSPLGLNLLQLLLIIFVFVIISLSALWIGTLIAALLRTKLGESSRGKDIGRALAMIIALPMVALIYAIQFGGLFEALANPQSGGFVTTILKVLPTSWGAEVIIDLTANPGNLVISHGTILRLIGLLAFFLSVFWAGKTVASHAYNLEPTTFISSMAKPNGTFYNTIKVIGGGKSFGTLLVSIFKDYSRRLENLSNVTYMIGLLFLMNVFIVPSYGSDEPPVALMMSLFIFPILVVMVVGGVTVHGKENLFIFKKVPSGIRSLVKARLVQSGLVVIPIVGVITTILMILNPVTQSPLILVINSTLLMTIIAADVLFVLGLFLLNPAFSAKSVQLFVNVLIVEVISILLFAIPMLILTARGMLTESFGGLTYVLLFQACLSWLVGGLLLFLGVRKLQRIE